MKSLSILSTLLLISSQIIFFKLYFVNRDIVTNKDKENCPSQAWIQILVKFSLGP